MQAAKTYAESLFNEWEMNPTEENITTMAQMYSDDGGSRNNGGLYEQVTKYAMVPGVNEFLFNAGHVPGDGGLVYGESSSYRGYHIMYYVGENRSSREILADNALRNVDISAKAEELAAGYTVTERSGMRFMNQL